MFGNPTQMTDLSFPINGCQIPMSNGPSGMDRPLRIKNRNICIALPAGIGLDLLRFTDSGCSTTLLRPNAVNIMPVEFDFTSDATHASDIYPLVNFKRNNQSWFLLLEFWHGTTSMNILGFPVSGY